MKKWRPGTRTYPLVHLFYTSRIKVVSYLLFKNLIHPSRLPMAFVSVIISLLGAPLMLAQQVIFQNRLKRIRFQNNPPVFIIGHFRSGTTHLHKLMSKDREFGTPTIYHALFINYCLIGGNWLKSILAPLVPNKRIQDNVYVSMDEPEEDEIALFCYSENNGFTDFFFPKNGTYLDKYVLFTDDHPREKALWIQSYTRVLQIISYSLNKKNLLLKNPFNTARIHELDAMFPGSKFVFLIRNPYEVYASVYHWYRTLIFPLSFNLITEAELQEHILRRFKLIMSNYLDYRDRISPGFLVEINFEELQDKPIEVIRKVYDSLDLSGLDDALQEMKSYIESVKTYKRNSYPDLSSNTIMKINEEWGFVFDKWGYSRIEV